MDPSDLELVRGVRVTPALFNPMNSDFKFAYRKEKIWMELSTFLGINMNDARRRWTCLRDRYTRELKNRRLNLKADYPQDEFFKEMDFLRPYVRKRKERRSIVCKIKSDTSWDGKLEKHNCYDTCDSVYSTKIEVNPSSDSNFSCTKMETNANAEEVNVEEIFQDYEDGKGDTISLVVHPNPNSMPEEVEEEPLISEENYEEYQEQSEGDSLNHTVIQNLSTETSKKSTKMTNNNENETEDDFFCKSICGYLRQLSRVHKIKAKVEMFQILQKYIEIEES